MLDRALVCSEALSLKGTRIGIETILYNYIYHAKTPEEIAQTYLSLNLEQIYATILFYLHNKEKITNYLSQWIQHGKGTSMPVHLAEHLGKGRHVPGIFILNPNLSVGENLEELILVAEASFDNEHQDRIDYLPFV